MKSTLVRSVVIVIGMVITAFALVWTMYADYATAMRSEVQVLRSERNGELAKQNDKINAVIIDHTSLKVQVATDVASIKATLASMDKSMERISKMLEAQGRK